MFISDASGGLAGVVISQCVQPGAPVIYTGTPARADMSTMSYASGAVETAMLAAAAHQLARHVGLPNFCSGGWSDAKIPDAVSAGNYISFLMQLYRDGDITASDLDGVQMTRGSLKAVKAALAAIANQEGFGRHFKKNVLAAYHSPRVIHGIKAVSEPLLVLYLWQGKNLFEKSRVETVLKG